MRDQSVLHLIHLVHRRNHYNGSWRMRETCLFWTATIVLILNKYSFNCTFISSIKLSYISRRVTFHSTDKKQDDLVVFIESNTIFLSILDADSIIWKWIKSWSILLKTNFNKIECTFVWYIIETKRHTRRKWVKKIWFYQASVKFFHKK